MPLKRNILNFALFVLLIMNCSVINFYDDRNTTIQELNKGLDDLSKTLNIKLIDTYSPFIDAEGKPNPDYYVAGGIHLSKDGYSQWVNKALLPFLSQQPFNQIAMVGNSITAGIENYYFGKNDSTISNWEYLLNVKTFNLGISGNTSDDIINRLNDIAAHKSDCYFLMIGINDINNRKAPVWKILENIQTIAVSLSNGGSHVVFQYVIPILE